MTFLVVLVAILAAGGLIAWSAGRLVTGRRIERRLIVNGMTRKYIAWLPASRRKNSPLAVVLAFHAGFGSAKGFEEHTLLHEAKQAERFIVVYPEGYKRSWNAHDCCGAAFDEKIDDRKFVLALLDDLETVFPIDRRRIFGTGFSNGARLCYHLACTMSDIITAIAPVGTAVLTHQTPSRPVPIFHMHGLDDKWAPYRGGASARIGAPFAQPVEKSLEFWRRLAGTSTVARGSMFGGAAECDTYSGAPDGTKILLCRIPGLGHHWPGTRLTDAYRQFLTVHDLGPAGPPIDVNDAVLQFFSAFALPEKPARQVRLARGRAGRRVAVGRRRGGVPIRLETDT